MNACSAANWSLNGLITALVAKQKTNPKNIEIGNAGKAFRLMANSNNVRHNPLKERSYHLGTLTTQNWIYY